MRSRLDMAVICFLRHDHFRLQYVPNGAFERPKKRPRVAFEIFIIVISIAITFIYDGRMTIFAAALNYSDTPDELIHGILPVLGASGKSFAGSSDPITGCRLQQVHWKGFV